MTEFKALKEYLHTGLGTEGTILIARKILPVIVDESEKMLIPRELAAQYYGPGQVPGSSIEINRRVEDTLRIRLIAEGAEIALDQGSYNNLNVRPRKYGVAIKITREMLEDANFNLLEYDVRIAGRRFAENENSLVLSALDQAANTVSGGAAITIANITTAIQNLHDGVNPKRATDFIIGTVVLNDLQNIDTFVEADKLGSTEMIQRGFVGRLYGMNVILCAGANIGMTSTTSYVLDRMHAYVIVEKRPVTVEYTPLPLNDMEAAVLTQRIDVQPLRTNATCRITTT